jgi:hypothetical protein
MSEDVEVSDIETTARAEIECTTNRVETEVKRKVRNYLTMECDVFAE